MIAKIVSEVDMARLSTRDDDDPTIALIDAWSAVLDVLTFYQERVANEGFLRTARQRRSILEMARAIGYELRPGVAASTYLAFTLDEIEGSPAEVDIEAGAKVQSVSGQYESPQMFETIEDIVARVEWNALKPRRKQPQQFSHNTTTLYIKGIDHQIKPGDAILLIDDHRKQYLGSERWDFRIIQTVDSDNKKDHTIVTWQEGLGHTNPSVRPADNPRAYVFRLRASLFGHNAPDWRLMSQDIKNTFDPQGKQRTQWPKFEIHNPDNREIHLDAVYKTIVEESWIVLEKPKYREVYNVLKVMIDSQTNYTLTAKTTRLVLDAYEHLDRFPVRKTAVHGQSEELPLAEEPITIPVFGDEIELEGFAHDITDGQVVAVSGVPVTKVRVWPEPHVIKKGSGEYTIPRQVRLYRDDGGEPVVLEHGEELTLMEPCKRDGYTVEWHLEHESGVTGRLWGARTVEPVPAADDDETTSEIAVVSRIQMSDGRATLVLSSLLENAYIRDTVTINANVALATHGETVLETLGSGNGSDPMQRFQLKQKRLTHVSATTPSGSESTLQIKVDGITWDQIHTLHDVGPDENVFTARQSDDGIVTVRFGDGVTGARPPTGVENVEASYRTGLGLDGHLNADQLTLLLTRPLGVKEVTNPTNASGGADPEDRDEARSNAPLTVLTLDRIVSLRDFEDFARAFAGIGKAQANLVWQEERQVVHITVSGADGADVDSTLHDNLVGAINAARHPDQTVVVATYLSRSFDVEAKIKVDEAFDREKVFDDGAGALVDAFSFHARRFGQAVTGSEILTTLQGVEGVVAVDLDKLHLSDQPAELLHRLPARIAGAVTEASELLTINPDAITFSEMKL
jgi:hypothetical protein